MAISRILTGLRPTGPLHLGHKVGALDNWVILQNENKYESFFLIADTQALTTHSNAPNLIKQSISDVTLDMISVGLDPQLPNVHFVLQSSVLERYELSMLLQMVTPYSWIKNNPTVKQEMADLTTEMVVGFPSYPVDQAADILMVSPLPFNISNKLLVPVGKDQTPHIELTRKIARRFNNSYGVPLLPECEPLIGEVGRLVGIDGNEKMSKSKNNAIQLVDTDEVIVEKVNGMYTDPDKIKVSDLGNVEDHVPLKYLRIFHSDQDEIDEVQNYYENGRLGDVAIKALLVDTLISVLAPIRIQRAEALQLNIPELIADGTARCREIAKLVSFSVKDVMSLNFLESWLESGEE